MRTGQCALWVVLALATALSGCANESKAPDLGGGTQPATDAAAPDATETAGSAGDAPTANYGPENLMDPAGPLVNETAPDVFRARFETTAGTMVIEVTRAWAPNGADRFYNLVRNGYFDNTYFFRAMEGFMAQFGLPADPAVATAWATATIMDDPPAGQSNTPGMVTFAKTGAPNSRSTQLFVNFGNNANLDPMGFTPIGKVVEGMDAVNAIHTGYGESRPRGMGPTQPEIQQKGSAFLASNYPDLTRIERTSIVTD
ncbi:MAG: peptidylprolyl isomerase [Planctomycetota bacterium]|jgi:peptidyl-prolyl cis-trans isomerase A (cyclophilin A)